MRTCQTSPRSTQTDYSSASSTSKRVYASTFPAVPSKKATWSLVRTVFTVALERKCGTMQVLPTWKPFRSPIGRQFSQISEGSLDLVTRKKVSVLALLRVMSLSATAIQNYSLHSLAKLTGQSSSRVSIANHPESDRLRKRISRL